MEVEQWLARHASRSEEISETSTLAWRSDWAEWFP